MDTSGEWNDYSRLKWGAEHGYLYAYPVFGGHNTYFSRSLSEFSIVSPEFFIPTERPSRHREPRKKLMKYAG
jgi:hypothetical protein